LNAKKATITNPHSLIVSNVQALLVAGVQHLAPNAQKEASTPSTTMIVTQSWNAMQGIISHLQYCCNMGREQSVRAPNAMGLRGAGAQSLVHSVRMERILGLTKTIASQK
jgi:hypothetical protein